MQKLGGQNKAGVPDIEKTKVAGDGDQDEPGKAKLARQGVSHYQSSYYSVGVNITGFTYNPGQKFRSCFKDSGKELQS